MQHAAKKAFSKDRFKSELGPVRRHVRRNQLRALVMSEIERNAKPRGERTARNYASRKLESGAAIELTIKRNHKLAVRARDSLHGRFANRRSLTIDVHIGVE